MAAIIKTKLSGLPTLSAVIGSGNIPQLTDLIEMSVSGNGNDSFVGDTSLGNFYNSWGSASITLEKLGKALIEPRDGNTSPIKYYGVEDSASGLVSADVLSTIKYLCNNPTNPGGWKILQFGDISDFVIFGQDSATSGIVSSSVASDAPCNNFLNANGNWELVNTAENIKFYFDGYVQTGQYIGLVITEDCKLLSAHILNDNTLCSGEIKHGTWGLPCQLSAALHSVVSFDILATAASYIAIDTNISANTTLLFEIASGGAETDPGKNVSVTISRRLV